MRKRRQLLIDCIEGKWRFELHREMDRYGVRVLIVGHLRFVWTWPVPPIETAASADDPAALQSAA